MAMSRLSSPLQLGIGNLPNTTDPVMMELLAPIHNAIWILAQYLDGAQEASGINAATVPTATLRTSAINRLVCKSTGTYSKGTPVYFTVSAGELVATAAAAAAINTLAMGIAASDTTAGNYAEFTPGMGLIESTAYAFSVGVKYYLADGGGYNTVPGTVPQFLGVGLQPNGSTYYLLMMLGAAG